MTGRGFARVFAVAFAIVLWPCSITTANPVSVVRVATGLEQPVYVTSPPGDHSRLFIVEANSGGSPTGTTIAQIKILNLTGPNQGTVNATPFLTLTGIPQLFGDRRLGQIDAEFQKLAVNPGSAPQQVGPRHPANHVTDLGGNRWPATFVSTFPGPVVLEALPVPPDHGHGLDDD